MKRFEFRLNGLDCANCAQKVENAIKELDGVENVNVNFSKLKLTYETDTVLEEDIIKLINSIEPEVVVEDYNSSSSNAEKIEEELIKYELECIVDCAKCALEVEEGLNKIEGIENASLNFAKSKLVYYSKTIGPDEVEKLVLEIEPEAQIKHKEHYHEHGHDHEHCHCGKCHVKGEEKKEKLSRTTKSVIRLIVGLVLALVGYFNILNNTIISEGLIIAGYFILLMRTMKNAANMLIKSKSINENFLITISCIGAYLVNEKCEGLMVIVLYEIGKILEEKAINKSRKSISDLMDIKPKYANKVFSEEDIRMVNPEEVEIDDIIVVKKGEEVPLDGVVTSGESKLNVASITGESKLFDVKEGTEVYSGSINEENVIYIKVQKEYKNSVVNKILELVENATDKKAKTETFVNKVTKIYTPIVLLLAIIVAVGLPLVSNVPFKDSIYRALIFLVISCPCAFAISVPLSYFSGIGKSSKEGVLIKGSDYLDTLKDVNVICFDKTGTLTKGKFEVDTVTILDSSKDERYLLERASIGESFSNHPIAKSIINKAEKENIDYKSKVDEINDFKEITGKGISYNLEGNNILIGNKELVEYSEDVKEVGTVIFVKENDSILGYIILRDIIKDDVVEAVKKLKAKNIVLKMFTGDNIEVAKDVAGKIGIDEVKAEMLPNEKYEELEKIINSNTKNGKVAFVGDGINDSPVIARADIGISMGGVGQDAAIQVSDVVIMTDSIEKIDEAINISKFTNRIIKENLIFAAFTKILVLILSTIGIAGMWQAIFADVGVTLITILNTLRILKKKHR